MSLVDAPISYWPPRGAISMVNVVSNATFDSSADALVAVFQIPHTGTIDNVHYRISAVTSPSMTHRIELRTVNTTTGIHNAAGTLYGSSTSITVAASGYAANTNYTAAVNCTGATKGDVCAVVFDLSAFTSGSFTQVDRACGVLTDVGTGRQSAFPYGIRNTAGSDTVNTFPPTGFALEYAGGLYVPVTPWATNFVGTQSSAAVTNSGTTRRGNKWTVPSPRRIVGIGAACDIDGAGAFKVWNSGGTVLATATVDKDLRGNTGGNDSVFLFDSGATITCAAGDVLYFGFEGTDATGGTLYFITAVSNAMLGCLPGGINCHGFTYAGSFSDATTTLYAVWLITDQEDDGTGGGGGVIGVIGG